LTAAAVFKTLLSLLHGCEKREGGGKKKKQVSKYPYFSPLALLPLEYTAKKGKKKGGREKDKKGPQTSWRTNTPLQRGKEKGKRKGRDEIPEHSNRRLKMPCWEEEGKGKRKGGVRNYKHTRASTWTRLLNPIQRGEEEKREGKRGIRSNLSRELDTKSREGWGWEKIPSGDFQKEREKGGGERRRGKAAKGVNKSAFASPPGERGGKGRKGN